jgi:DNA polymerase-1
MRALIRPPEGHGIAYVDFAAQEIGLAATLSGDARMLEGYLSGDPHIHFAVMAGLAPPGANKRTHPQIRARCKQTNLGVNYGMGRDLLSIKLGIGLAAADTLLRLHRRVYATYWDWTGDEGRRAMARGIMSTAFGWHRRLVPGVDMKSVRNFAVQANANEMLRVATVVAVEAGLSLCCPVHDALLLLAPLDRLDEDVAHLRYLMGEAGRVVSGGLTFLTDQ